jgi:hypothetical protein
MFPYKLSLCMVCVLVAIITLFAQISASLGADRLLAWPAEWGGKESKVREPLKSHEIRRGGITLTQDILPKPSETADHRTSVAVSKGETVSVRLFDDVSYDVDIDSTTHHKNGTISVRGKIRDHNMGTVVTTVGPEGFLMTVHDMKRSRLYRVTGDSQTGVGSVTEIDTRKMPPVIR